MTENPVTSKRPGAITAICVICFCGFIVSLLALLSPFVAQIGAWYPPFLAVSIAVGVASTIGFWKMKKWSVYLYSGFFVIGQIVMLATHTWHWAGLVLPMIVIGVLLRHLKKMT